MSRDADREVEALLRRGARIFLQGISAASRAAGSRGAGGLDGVAAAVAAAWHRDLLAGYRKDPARILKPIASRAAEDLVAVRDLEFTSICRHHLLPFSGKVHLAYAPRGVITGLSSLGRLVDCLSRRLQLQEDLTREIAEAIQRHLGPAGAACLIEASHACMTVRGARKSHSRVMTAAFTGRFRRVAAARREALAILGGGGGRARARRPSYRGRRVMVIR